MNDKDQKPQPWHEADEKPAAGKGSHAPIGTHSLTGGGSAVGMPATPADPEVERSEKVDEAAGTDMLREPRAGGGDLLGTKKR